MTSSSSLNYGIFPILEAAAQKYSNRPAIIDSEGSLSFSELLEQVLQLREKLSFSQLTCGMGVGLLAPQGRQFVIALFALSACGPVVLPLDSNIRAGELLQLRNQIPLHAILAHGLPIRLASNEINFTPVPGAATWSTAHLRANTNPDFAAHIPQACLLRPSSGTTGAAKGVILSSNSVVARVKAASVALALPPDEKVIWVLPMAYHFIVSIITYVYSGCCLVVTKNHLAQSIIDATNQHSGSMLYAAPTHFALLAEDSSSRLMPSLTRAFCTSAAITPAVAAKFEARFSLPVRQLYGNIEVGLPLGNLQTPPAPRSCLGKVLPPYEAQIQDELGNSCPAENSGELVIKGPGMFDGYLSPPLPQQQVTRNGWFLTGDIAVQHADGNFEILGRKKSVIITAGNKVHAEEVEAVLNAHPMVEISRVYGKHHALLGELVAAQVKLRDGAQVTAAELRSFCSARLSSFKVPGEITQVEAIELTNTGKVRR